MGKDTLVFLLATENLFMWKKCLSCNHNALHATICKLQATIDKLKCDDTNEVWLHSCRSYMVGCIAGVVLEEY